jgi:uncharacterized protein YdhG (YjbR/CyaY superfamily)
MKKLNPQDVDTYISKAKIDSRPLLVELRQLVKRVVPDVEEGTWYGVPFYMYHGQLVGFAAYKRHASIGFGTDVLQGKDKNLLEQDGYKTGLGTIQIRYDQMVPAMILERILKAKADVNESQRIIKG